MKYVDELKEIQEKFDNQSFKLTKLINEVNENNNNNISKLKDNVKDLEEEKSEIINKSNKKIQTLEKNSIKMKDILIIMKKIELKQKKNLIN